MGGFGNNGIHSADVRVQGKFSFPIVVALQPTAAVADSMADLQQRLDRVRLPESLRLAPSDERYVLHGPTWVRGATCGSDAANSRLHAARRGRTLSNAHSK